MLLDFFRKRLRVDSAYAPQPGLASLLVRRTFGRIANRRVAERQSPDEGEVSSPRLQKAEVLHAALMELRQLEDLDDFSPDKGRLRAHRN